jgi:hypothetical protein
MPMTTSTSTPAATSYTSPFAGPADDLEAIRQTVEHYDEGLRSGSVERLREAFHEQSQMCGYLGDAPMLTPIAGLYDFVASHDAPAKSGEPTEITLAAVQVSGNTATAEVVERAYMGHDFLTSFQLLKLDGRWWIVAKLFHGTPRE